MQINNMKIKAVFTILFSLIISIASSQTLLRPDRVFDGNSLHEGWVVLVEGNKITQIGFLNSIKIPKGTKENNVRAKRATPK